MKVASLSQRCWLSCQSRNPDSRAFQRPRTSQTSVFLKNFHIRRFEELCQCSAMKTSIGNTQESFQNFGEPQKSVPIPVAASPPLPHRSVPLAAGQITTLLAPPSKMLFFLKRRLLIRETHNILLRLSRRVVTK